MTLFVDLHTYCKAFFLLLFFFSVNLSFCLTLWSLRYKFLLPKIISPLCGFVCVVFFLPFATDILSARFYSTASAQAYTAYFTSLPAWIVIATALLTFCLLIGIIFFLYRKSNSNLSPFSVKESLDKLKTGICFAYKSGMIKLINRKMDALHRIIVGYEMQNALEFISILQNGQLQPGVERLQFGEKITLRLPDCSVWSFSVRETEKIIEITAADTSDIYRVSEELQASNAELRFMNDRLEKYGENVDELTKARERLETKHRIHADLGNTLLATRLFLQNHDGNPDELIKLWKRNIIVLGGEDNALAYDALQGLFRAAQAVGIRVEMTGEIPEKESIKRLFLDAAAEALTNAVKHADASEFSVSFSSDLFSCTASFTNNINKPLQEIREGGGLSSIRKKTQQIGGRMTVETEPEFTLKLKVPK